VRAFLILSAMAAVFAAGPVADAKEPSIPSGPAYFGVFEAIVDGRHLQLERQSATMETRGRLMGGMDMYYRYEGAHSPVRFQARQNPYFIVRASTDVDPAAYLFLSTVQSKGNVRRAVVASRGIYGGPNVDVMGVRNRVAVSYEPLGREFMIIKPTAPLSSGEYMLTSSGPSSAFLFGVD
jgi:hypothetical protein